MSGNPNFSRPQRHRDSASAATVLTQQPGFTQLFFYGWKHSPLCFATTDKESPLEQTRSTSGSCQGRVISLTLPRKETRVKKEHTLPGLHGPDFVTRAAFSGTLSLIYMHPTLQKQRNANPPFSASSRGKKHSFSPFLSPCLQAHKPTGPVVRPLTA